MVLRTIPLPRKNPTGEWWDAKIGTLLSNHTRNNLLEYIPVEVGESQHK